MQSQICLNSQLRNSRYRSRIPVRSGRPGDYEGVRRVVILGRGGAGKSTLARQLSGLTGVPPVELDALLWQPGPP